MQPMFLLDIMIYQNRASLVIFLDAIYQKFDQEI